MWDTLFLFVPLLLVSAGTVTYTASTAVIANPERGFDHTATDCATSAFDVPTLQGFRHTENVTLVLCVFYISATADLTTTQLSFLNTQFSTIRSAGLKTILRFAYSDTSGQDATLTQITRHLDQLTPSIQSNYDIIAIFQAGSVGQYGEWYYTTNFGDSGTISAQQWIDRKSVVDKMLTVLPTSRMVSLRTPNFVIHMYGSTPISSATAFDQSSLSRLGQHNDAFVSDDMDQGTYLDPTTEFPWLRAQSMYAPMGGESDAYNPPRSNCTNALIDMTQFHWDYINTDYFQKTITAWGNQGCLDVMNKRLGYRFVLQQAVFPSTSTQTGSSFSFQASIFNNGFSSPFNPRGFELILRQKVSPFNVYNFTLTSDPRKWMANTTTTINETVVLTGVPVGTYALLLNLPDPALRNRSEYSIQFANLNTWEANTGFNNLNTDLDVIAATPTPPSPPTTSVPTSATSPTPAMLPSNTTANGARLLGPSVSILGLSYILSLI